jgi:hypothetical protein
MICFLCGEKLDGRGIPYTPTSFVNRDKVFPEDYHLMHRFCWDILRWLYDSKRANRRAKEV